EVGFDIAQIHAELVGPLEGDRVELLPRLVFQGVRSDDVRSDAHPGAHHDRRADQRQRELLRQLQRWNELLEAELHGTPPKRDSPVRYWATRLRTIRSVALTIGYARSDGKDAADRRPSRDGDGRSGRFRTPTSPCRRRRCHR